MLLDSGKKLIFCKKRFFQDSGMGPEKCPFCGQEIDTEAIKCFFCGSSLDHNSVESRLDQLHKQEDIKHNSRSKSSFAVKIFVFIILVFTVLFVSKSKIKPSLTEAVPTQGSTILLNAEVTLSGSHFIITNNDSFDWINVELQIISDYVGNDFVTMIPKISAGRKLSVRAAEFTQKDGVCFDPYTMKSQSFRIRCNTSTKENGTYYAGLKNNSLNKF